MGLGTAGLLGGLGKGLVDLGLQKAKSQDQERFLKLEEAREIRLQQLRTQGQMDVTRLQGQQQQEQQAQDNIAKTVQQGQENEARAALQSQELEARSKESGKDREFKATEGAKDRASAEKIAGIRSNPNGKNPPGGKFTTNTITATRVGEGGFPEQFDTLAVTRGGRTFVQTGDAFVPYSAGETVKPPAKRADKNALSFLNKNPTQAEAFLERYGYLPARFITQLQGDAGSAPAEDDDE